MTGTLQSHQTHPTMVIQNGMVPTMTPMGSMMAPPNMGAPLVMTTSSHNLINGAQTPVAPVIGYPTQPLPPAPPATSMSNNLPPPQLIQNGFNMNPNRSTDSFSYIPTATKGQDSPQLSSSGRGSIPDSSGRPQTPPLKTSRPTTPVQQPLQPMGLPTNRAKLVPGRMSNHKLDGSTSRPGGQGGRAREIPSTAV